MNSGLHAIAELIALRLLDSLAEGALVCALAAIVLRLTPRRNAATRFAVWFSALVAIAALPWIGKALPHPGLATSAVGHAAIVLPSSWALYFSALWGIVALWFVIGVVRALLHLNALRRSSIPLPPAALDPIVRQTLERHCSRRGIVLCTSEDVQVPTAVGLFRPRILVPSWVVRELSPTDLNQVLLHELAHFRRWDDWTNLAQQVLKAAFFFHPAVWWIDKKIAIEREIACDDAVLAETRRPRAYAECLAHLAEKSFVRRSIALAQAALGHVRQTSARIAQILDVNRTAPTSRPWAGAVSITAVLALGCGVFYSGIPEPVAFGNSNDSHNSEVAAVPAHVMPETGVPRSLPVVQAKFRTDSAAAKLNANLLEHKKTSIRHGLPLQTKPSKPQDQNLVHLTASKSSITPVAETVWVVVQNEPLNPADPQVYQIQMWRVTVLRTVIAPSRQISRSEI
jgi:beta-lactamase regulating signal transducer with metallopeptidase domain